MRQNTITIAALNIVMPVPHSSSRYTELFNDAFALHRIISLRGNHQAKLGSLAYDNKKRIITGQIYKFFDLDISGSWFNLVEHRPAEDSELEQVKVPVHLKPDFKFFDYVFFPQHHRLVFICRDKKDSLSVMLASKFFLDLFTQAELMKKYGRIDVIVEPNHETLNRIFEIHKLTRLFIEIIPPNADDLQVAEGLFMEQMNIMHATKMTSELTSDKPSGLVPDEKTRKLAQIARSNGKVIGRGLDEQGRSIELSTVDHPYLDRFSYIPSLESRLEIFIQKAQIFLNKLIS